MNDRQQVKGVTAAFVAYLLWGVLPLYWKLLDHVPSEEVLAHRIVWSLVFMVIMLVCMRKVRRVTNEIRAALTQPKAAFSILLAAIIISMNWFVFIFTVNSDRVIEASLGYYINPLINVLLATIFLKERLSRSEWLACCLAAVGVLIMTASYGHVPWAALFLALTFGFYGLIKKTVPIGTWAGLTVETLLMAPFALLFLLFTNRSSETSGVFFTHGVSTFLLFIGAGVVTAIPLLLFATGARLIPLSLIGFLQYLSPTIIFLFGVFVFKEPINYVQLVSFVIIWIGLVLFTTSRSKAAFSKVGQGATITRKTHAKKSMGR